MQQMLPAAVRKKAVQRGEGGRRREEGGRKRETGEGGEGGRGI